jgi:hypothetical protein
VTTVAAAVAAGHDAPRAGCAGRADTVEEYDRVVAITVTRRFRLGYKAGGVSPCQGSSYRPGRYRVTTAPYARQNAPIIVAS